MLLYGKNALVEFLKKGKPKSVQLLGSAGKPSDLALAKDLDRVGVSYKLTTRDKLDQISPAAKHQGVIFEVPDFQYTELETCIQKFPDKALFLVCDSIQDPQNFGAICRSAHCFGVNAIICNKDRSVEVTPAVFNASAGAVFHIPIVRVVNISRAIEQLKEAGFWAYAADPSAHDSLETVSLSDKMAVVMGNEKEGIRPLVQKNCDFQFTIPMKGSFDSLNVAQATSIILYRMTTR